MRYIYLLKYCKLCNSTVESCDTRTVDEKLFLRTVDYLLTTRACGMGTYISFVVMTVCYRENNTLASMRCPLLFEKTLLCITFGKLKEPKRIICSHTRNFFFGLPVN